MKIALAKITAHQHAQPRAAIQTDTVSEYAADMERGDVFPPCTVFYDGKRYWLADGFHRLYAAQPVGITEIECEVREGTKDDAIWFSCGANKAHGFRRTNEDKRRAVIRLATHPKFKPPRRTQEEIAEQCGVTQAMVSKIIKELEAENITVIPVKEDQIEPADRVASPRPGMADAKLDGSAIAKSLHEIERHIDMMPTPTAAAQAFPDDQRYLFPLAKLDEMATWMTNFAEAYRKLLKSQVAAE